MQQYTKSRTFAVVIPDGHWLRVHFIWRKTEVGTQAKELHLGEATLRWQGEDEDREKLINLLTVAGHTVRYYDPEESQWMDVSSSLGLIRAPGPRDGQWGEPSLEEFEENYLKVQ